MNDDDNFIHKYYAPFLSLNNHSDVSTESNMIQRNEEFVAIKTLFFIFY